MMSGDKELKASEKISEYLNQINEYINITNTKHVNFKEEYLIVADMNSEQLRKLTQSELFDAAYLLYSYATHVQDEINKNKIALAWCHDEIEKMIVRYSDEFGQYTKHESKKYILAQNNSYAASLENMRQTAEGRIHALEGKVFELKRKADILLEKGKRS